MRKLYPEEKEIALQVFDADRPECMACPYPARVDYKLLCGLVYYDCLVSVPVCLEKRGKRNV